MRSDRKARRIDWTFRRALKSQSVSNVLEVRFGYSLDDLRQHIERQFTDRMTWAAFADGEIHIDHIVPLAAFDLSDEREVRAAYALSNLRPLWASENTAKGASREFLL